MARWTQLVTALLAAAIFHALPAAAQTTTSTAPAGSEDANKHSEAGRNLYKEGKYLEAIEEFRKAYAVAPTPALTYNIARCHERLSQWQEAIQMYERYSKEAPDAKDRAEALDKIELLKKKTGGDLSTPDAQYQARIDAGRKAYARGDYEGAIPEFQAAFEIKATTGALYNIAKCYEKMARYEEAIDYYQRYIDLDPKVSDADDVKATIKRLTLEIKSKFKDLNVSSDPPGADIYLDDRNTGLVGQTNFRFKVTPGPHIVFVDANGFEPVKRDFIMPDDKDLALDFKMTKLENVGFLEIKVNQDGARIFVDGAIVGLSPYKEKKALTAGAHQVQVELPPLFERSTLSVNVIRDQTLPVAIELVKYDAPISDDTLSKWGRNFLLIGLISGTLGLVGPFAYQKIVLHRSPYEQLGPAALSGDKFYRGPIADENSPDFRKDPTHRTLSDIQFWSVVGGSVFVAGGVAFYVYKFARTTPPPAPVVTASNVGEQQESPASIDVSITGFGLAPSGDGGTMFGLSGSF